MKLSTLGLLAVLALAPATSWAQAPATPAVSDEALSEQIAHRISGDPTLKADAVKVTVEDHVVTLSGMVATEADRARAGRLANVAGVTRVENNIVTRSGAKEKVKGTAGTAGEKTKEGAKKAGEKTKSGLSKTGEVITDGWISTRIKTKYMGDDNLRASDIKVDTNDHVVTLTGTVVNAAAKAKAVADAKEVEGVDRVIDKLTIGPRKP